ncbi:acetyltransferase [Accumulibacter sp.]|uniref:acetyltransferase n=1 Tax=Accumulibacter sp. TaxID=2053492 RepID=UPI0025CDD010|nr:acetyltransferase [Accumulibacter sp.]MCM8594246.1 acetyltransferase [Accumulibacter sp.]MCM8625812.1 acetyltransferase [Accumulibacter sp.]MDS4048390.1 acetyltransferase [Accumulibacter sp.]
MKRLALLGASGHGKVVADAALSSGWASVVFFDDAWPKCNRNGAWSILGNAAQLMARLEEFQGVLVSIGDCPVRWEKHRELFAAGAPLTTVVHPAATVSRYARLGAGTVVMAGAVVAIDAIVGQAAIINNGATVDHDCRIADAVHIAPGANLSGGVEIGRCSWVGVGATVRQGIHIGEQVVVGAGAVVVRPVPDGCTVVGNPARTMRIGK